MDKITILHLSDLHIDNNEDPIFTRTRETLIKDVKTIIEELNVPIDIAVITGDIFDKGKIEENYEMALAFCRKLETEFDLAGKIAIVPGNHDVPRRDVVKLLRDNAMFEEDGKGIDKFRENWESVEGRFKGYNKFATEIMKETTWYFGGTIKEFETARGTVQTTLLNTAWATSGRDDYQKLLIGRWQLESLKKEKEKLKEPVLSIALMHHPLDWLKNSEKSLIGDFIQNPELLNVDALLHGHIHDGGIEFSGSPDASMITLVSGLGYPEAGTIENGKPKVSKCRYGLYQFDAKTGMLDVCLRISDTNGNFAADTLLYKSGKESGRFTIPYKRIDKKKSPTRHSCTQLDPIPSISGWVGREEEMNRMSSVDLRMVAITGIGGQGKTGLAAEFMKRSTQKYDSRFEAGIWCDCRELPDSIHSKMIQLSEAISGGEEKATLFKDELLIDTVKRLIRHLQNKKILIVLDNVDPYINQETERPENELAILFDAVVNKSHDSLVILTSRKPINDASASFSHIKLKGLDEDEGIKLFEKRDIVLEKCNDKQYCREIIKYTSGHPWWLGLIAGQVRTHKDSFKSCVDKFKAGEGSLCSGVSEYFEDIWSSLRRKRKDILRYLVESPSPLSQYQIKELVKDTRSVRTIMQEVGALERLGLLERHLGGSPDLKYQVHPLVREFVHKTYDTSKQRTYVHRILHLFLPGKIITILFKNAQEFDRFTRITMLPEKIIESIETCLGSRNISEALALLVKYRVDLCDSGYHHQFKSLACRTVNLIQWNDENLLNRHLGVLMLQDLIEQLYLSGDEDRSDQYLDCFCRLVTPESSAQLGYYSSAAYSEWLKNNYETALGHINQYEIQSKKISAKGWSNQDVLATKGLILRDSGRIEEAIEIFKESARIDYEDDINLSSSLGNLAKCLMKLNRNNEAEKLLKRSLQILKGCKSYLAGTNIGYAYSWLSEIKMNNGEMKEANQFYLLAKETWEEYAPGLLHRLKGGDEIEEDDQIKKELRVFEREFLTMREADAISIEDI